MREVHPAVVPPKVRRPQGGRPFPPPSPRGGGVVGTSAGCHPAYTGVERAVLSGSRIEQFERRRQLAGRK